MALRLKYLAGGALLSVALAASWTASAQDVIKIGIPVGLSGANSVVAPSVVQSAELAVEEINAKGGIMGKKVVLEVADDGSGAAGAQKAFDSLIFQKKVNVLISMETSAARNAGLPIVSRGKTPFIYTSFYEGRSCNKYLYVNAWVPDQQVAPIVDLLHEEVQRQDLLPDRQRLRVRSRHAAVHPRLHREERRQGAGRGVSADGWLGLDCGHQQAQGRQARCADHLHRRRRTERDAHQAAARGGREHPVRQPRGR